MNRHRVPGLTEPVTRPAVAPALSMGFVVCPVGLPGAAWQWQQIYQMAYEQARAVTQPSLVERYLVPSLN